MQASSPGALATLPRSRAGRLHKPPIGAVIAAIALVSLGLGLYQLLRSGAAHDILEYDDGVWFGSALRLVDGAVPYRDFVLDQPPGVPVLLAPLAALSKVMNASGAFATARYVTIAVQAATVVLVGRLLRGRSLICVAVACTVASVDPAAVITSRTVMLEPYCDFFCLLGLSAAFQGCRLTSGRRRLVLSGVAFGVAGACKAFAIFPFAVLAVQLIVSAERGARGRALRRAGSFAAAAGGTFAVISSPFVVAAPAGYFRQVVLAQLQRAKPAMPDYWDRAAQLLGVPPAPSGIAQPGTLDMALVVIVAATVAVALAFAWRHARAFRGGGAILPPLSTGTVEQAARLSLARYAVVCTVVTTAGLIWPAAFYYHYAAFVAPFGAICLGFAAEAFARARPLALYAGAAAAILLVIGAAHVVRVVQTIAQPDHPQVRLVDRILPKGACAMTDNPALLILANRFAAPAGCTDLVDAYGSTVAWGDGATGTTRPAAVGKWLEVLRHTDYIVLTGGLKTGRVPWDATLRGYLQAHFRLAGAQPGVAIWERRG